jgi:hypothetical protein
MGAVDDCRNEDRAHDTRAYVFDAYGTPFDVHAAIWRHRAAAGPNADRFLRNLALEAA